MTPPGDPEQQDFRAERVGPVIRRWRQSLADVGGRNTLLWHRDSPQGVLDLTVAHPSGTAKLLAANVTRLSELVREPHAFAEALERAIAVRRKAMELADERGMRTCFLAIGTASWRIAGAATSPRAPILLRSCRIEPVDSTYRDMVLSLGEDVSFNPVLTHYLREQQGLDVDPTGIAVLARGSHGFDARPAFDALEEVCSELPGFSIAPQLVVSTFPWSKLGTVADLVLQAERLPENDVLAALAGDTEARRSLQEADAALNAELSAQGPDEAAPSLVLDADAEQTRVVRAVRTGASLVVLGAPGTGKVQTVANLAAALAADGKRVLVVAEKRAALEGVQRRLSHVGLADLVLRVGDDAVAAQRAAHTLLDSLATVAAPPPEGEAQAAADELASCRAGAARAFARLRDEAEHAHRVRRPWGASVHQAQQELTRMAQRRAAPVSRVRLSGADLRVDGLEGLAHVAARLAEAARRGAWTGGAEDLWYGARVATSAEAERVLAATRRLAGDSLAEDRRVVAETAESVGLPEPTSIAAWGEHIELMDEVLTSLDTFVPAVFEVPLDDMVAATAEGGHRDEDARDMGAFTRSRHRRAARRLLRPGPPPEDLHARLRRAREQRRRWERLGGRLARPEAAHDLERAATAYERVRNDLATVAAALHPSRCPDDLTTVPLDRVAALAGRLLAQEDRLAVVPQVREPLDEADAAGLGPVVTELARRGVPADEVEDLVRFIWFTSLLQEARSATEAEQAREGLAKAWRTFVREDRGALRAEASLIALGIHARAHDLLARAPEQVARLGRRFEQVTRPEELRAAWRTGGGVVPTLRPVTVTSPLAVGATLPVGRLFDCVIVLQAEQVALEHAIPTIARGRQVVVVGDLEQPGPRSFSVVADRRAEGQIAAAAPGTRPRSVLAAAAEVLPVLRLTRHYRSADERLAAALQRRVYPGAMSTTPGTSTAPPVAVETVPAHGERGRQFQADRVVELVLDHARRRPQLSLGVITFSAARAVELDAALREVVTAHPELHGSFREKATEAFFIKPAHRAAGDVRDAIIVDVAGLQDEAPPGGGVLEGAEGRALAAAALGAARRHLQIVTPEGLLPGGSGDDGLALLAEAARPHPPAEGEREVSPILADLADRLRREGLTVTTRYGCGEDTVELAVMDPARPGCPLLAILTDAPWGERVEILDDTGRTPAQERRLAAWGRDRERLRTEQLTRLGWTPVRVWTEELFTDPARVVSRIVIAAREASAARAEASGQAHR